MLLNREPWAGSAVCAQTDPNIFHPDIRDRTSTARAKAVCTKCPVLAECREWVMRIEANLHPGDVHGIVARMTPEERKMIRFRSSLPTRCPIGHALTEDTAEVTPSGLVCKKCATPKTAASADALARRRTRFHRYMVGREDLTPTCRNGHTYTPETTRITKQGRTCLICQRDWKRAKRDTQPRTKCRNGHEYTEDNTVRQRDGSRKCATCMEKNRARTNRARAEKRRREREARRVGRAS